MNSKLFLYMSIVLFSFGCKNNNFKISGTLLNHTEGTYIVLDELKKENLVPVDSVKISSDGTFSIKREAVHPSFYLLKSSKTSFLTLLVEPGEKITVKAYIDSLNYPISIKGSKGTESMSEYNKTLHETIKKLGHLNNIYLENEGKPELPKVIQMLDSLANIYLGEINQYTKKYIDDNLNSLITLVALYQQVAPGVYVLNPAKDMKYYHKVDSTLFSRYPDYEPVISLHEQVKELSAGFTGKTQASEADATGRVAPEIALPTPQGDTIKLSSTRGSFVLLDFWASWCSPCRKENPNLVDAYDTFHKKGFQIYQVSLDKTKEAWVKGIQEDHLEKWIHVSDVQYWNSTVVPLYRIESIPCNYLLDKEGHIISSNLRGEQLKNKLAEILK